MSAAWNALVMVAAWCGLPSIVAKTWSESSQRDPAAIDAELAARETRGGPDTMAPS